MQRPATGGTGRSDVRHLIANQECSLRVHAARPHSSVNEPGFRLTTKTPVIGQVRTVQNVSEPNLSRPQLVHHTTMDGRELFGGHNATTDIGLVCRHHETYAVLE